MSYFHKKMALYLLILKYFSFSYEVSHKGLMYNENLYEYLMKTLLKGKGKKKDLRCRLVIKQR